MTENKTCRASQACFNLIMQSEDEAGFLAGRCTKLKAYKPVPEEEGWTIGWGHHGAFEGQEITPETADALLLEDVCAVEADLRSITRGMRLAQNEWDALVSLCFNLRGGPRALPRIAPKLWRSLKAGDAPTAAHEFLDITRAGKVELRGLIRRRKMEAELFLGLKELGEVAEDKLQRQAQDDVERQRREPFEDVA